MIIEISKKIGETPNELIERFKNSPENSEFKDKKIAFAGRLDPMAFGKMMLLTDTDCLKMTQFCGYRKLYSFKCIKGIQTDTGDILGIPRKASTDSITPKLNPKKFYQKYPVYSSKRVNGKPLWHWARNNKLDLIEIPGKMVEIYSVVCNDNLLISPEDLMVEIRDRINQLNDKNRSNFRVDTILSHWEDLLNTFSNGKEIEIEIENYTLFVSSGTYIRGICDSLYGTAMDINRIEFVP